MNVIQTVKCAEELCDTTVTFSALTRVLHPSNAGRRVLTKYCIFLFAIHAGGIPFDG